MFRARKAICETANRLFCGADHLTCLQGNKEKNDCEVWRLKSSPFLRYKGNGDTRKWPVKFRDFRETGPWSRVTDIGSIWSFNACSIRNIEAAGRILFPLPDLSSKIEGDSTRRVELAWTKLTNWAHCQLRRSDKGYTEGCERKESVAYSQSGRDFSRSIFVGDSYVLAVWD